MEHFIGPLLSAVVAVASWEGWRLFRPHRGSAPAPGNGITGNGFHRDDHDKLVTIQHGLDELTKGVDKLNERAEWLDDRLGRLCVTLELEPLGRRPPMLGRKPRD